MKGKRLHLSSVSPVGAVVERGPVEGQRDVHMGYLGLCNFGICIFDKDVTYSE